VAYDEELAERVRERLAAEQGLTEQRMFGGIGFMLDGHMAVGVSGAGGLMLRVPHERTDELAAEPHAGHFEMRGRPMRGWLRVAAEGVAEDDDLDDWVAIGVRYVRTLPPK
jgi:TfoX/Sxy family transcriptional regulator of competence genes